MRVGKGGGACVAVLGASVQCLARAAGWTRWGGACMHAACSAVPPHTRVRARRRVRQHPEPHGQHDQGPRPRVSAGWLAAGVWDVQPWVVWCVGGRVRHEGAPHTPWHTHMSLRHCIAAHCSSALSCGIAPQQQCARISLGALHCSTHAHGTWRTMRCCWFLHAHVAHDPALGPTRKRAWPMFTTLTQALARWGTARMT